jgi:hypothetical protein
MPILVVVWANVHGSFVLAPLILGYAWLEDVVSGGEWRRSLVVLLVGTAATLVNPYGVGAWTYAANLGTDPVIRDTVSEWQRTSPLTIPGALFYASLVASAVFLLAHARTKGQVLLSDWIWLAGWGLIGAWAERGLAWWPFAAAFVVGTVIGRSTGDIGEPARAPRPNRLNAVVALALGLLIIVALPWWRPADPLTGREGLLSYAPPGLAQALRDSPPGGRVFTEQTWSSWFEWAAPEQLAFVDSRFELFPARVFNSYQAIVTGGDTALAELEANNVDLVVALDRSPLQEQLDAAGRRRVAEDQEAVLFQRPQRS